jgi:hypothetical protein
MCRVQVGSTNSELEAQGQFFAEWVLITAFMKICTALPVTVAHSFHHHHLFHDMFHDSDKECRQACVQQQRASISPRKDRRVTPRQPRPAALRTLLLAVRLYSGR